jgi:hypothetical protein
VINGGFLFTPTAWSYFRGHGKFRRVLFFIAQAEPKTEIAVKVIGKLAAKDARIFHAVSV